VLLLLYSLCSRFNAVFLLYVQKKRGKITKTYQMIKQQSRSNAVFIVFVCFAPPFSLKNPLWFEQPFNRAHKTCLFSLDILRNIFEPYLQMIDFEAATGWGMKRFTRNAAGSKDVLFIVSPVFTITVPCLRCEDRGHIAPKVFKADEECSKSFWLVPW